MLPSSGNYSYKKYKKYNMKKSFYLQSLLVSCFILLSVAAKATIPVIHASPRDTTVCDSALTFFSVAVTDTPGSTPITYSWQVSTDGGTTWSTVTSVLEYLGATTDSISIKADFTLSGHWYRAIATNSDGADTSTAAMLNVIGPNAGTIIGAVAVCKTGTITLSDAVTGGTWSSSNTSLATIGSSSGIVSGVNFGSVMISYSATNACGTDTTTYTLRIDTTVTSSTISGPGTTCKGNFITLTDPNVLGVGTWTSGNTTVAVVSPAGDVTGTGGGSTIIFYNFTNGCGTTSASFGVIVDTVLPHGIISGPSTLCFGTFVHLSETVSGGIWITGSSSVATVDGSGNVTGVSQGTAVISYLFSNACGTSIATDTVTVIRTSSVITGGDSVGIGNTRMLLDSAIGGMWFSNDTSIATIDTFTGLVKGIDTGITTITYTVTNICGTTTSLLTLNVGPAPTLLPIYGSATFDSAVCVGATVQVFDTTIGGVGRWSTSNDTIGTIDSMTGVFTGIKTVYNTHDDSVNDLHIGIDSVIYTFTNAFGTSRTTIPIIVNQSPTYLTVSGPAIVSTGGNYQISATPYYAWIHTPSSIYIPLGGAATVGTWVDSSAGSLGYIVGESDSSDAHFTAVASYVVTKAGRDKLTYTVSNGCGSFSQSVVMSLVLAPNAVTNTVALATGLNVYPNPTNGNVTINLVSDINAGAHVVISNVLGATIKELTIVTNKAYDITLDQPAGMYFITATTPSGKYDAKIVVGN